MGAGKPVVNEVWAGPWDMERRLLDGRASDRAWDRVWFSVRGPVAVAVNSRVFGPLTAATDEREWTS